MIVLFTLLLAMTAGCAAFKRHDQEAPPKGEPQKPDEETYNARR